MDARSECGFEVRQVTVEELPEDGAFVVALAEEPDGGGRLLMFQLIAAFDEQDVAQGQSTYCLCDEMGATVYGGVKGCVLAGNLLTIRLDTGAQRHSGGARSAGYTSWWTRARWSGLRRA